MSTNWRIRRDGVVDWVNLWVTKRDEEFQMETDEFGLQGRNYTGVSVGRIGGTKMGLTVLVRTASEDATLMNILKSREVLNVETSLNEAWDMRVVGGIDRKLNPTPSPAGSDQPIKHEFFLSFKLVQVA